ncbi:MAG: tetratricopeptide repeat protein [Pyrinomonadaceae bacterium]
MKKCPQCGREYDLTMSFCLDDGSELLYGPASGRQETGDGSLENEPATAILSESRPVGTLAGGQFVDESQTRQFVHTTDQTAILHTGAEAEPQINSSGLSERQSLSAHRAAKPQEEASDANRAAQPQRKVGSRQRQLAVVGIAIIILVGGFFGYRYFASSSKQIESIAVMPFVNESGNADVEYLSDGMTETLISSLSQLPNLNVKARSSVFRYKGKETNTQTIGKELNVQAILNGRVVQRGEDLILYVELVDAATENSLWKQTYNKTMANIVVLQNDIARDVADNLKVKLSGADKERLAKNYTQNTEAYQLYLKGRYHLLKTTRLEFQTSISYFLQAIAIDPAYALAYTGLADAYRSVGIAGEARPAEVMPKSKAAGQKAIEIDDTLADAHANYGFTIFWYDWDWNAAEYQYRLALELDPNNADAHLFYAHLLSNTGRHAEALREAKRAVELDPLNLRTNALMGLFLFHAGRTDEALASCHRTSELDANYWLPHNFAASAYIEKGMYPEAITEARKARAFSGETSMPIAFLGYVLAKSGKKAEAQAELDALLKLSAEGYVSPYSIALIHNGLGDHDETLAWLERAFQQRDPRMVFLKVEPKWNNLRGDPRFQNLMRLVGFTQ